MPLTRAQHLMWKLAEEAAEIVQEASKASIFGMTEVKPGLDINNAQRVVREIVDLWAIVEMLTDEGILPEPTYGEQQAWIYDKRMKVEKYLTYAREIGMLSAPPGAPWPFA